MGGFYPETVEDGGLLGVDAGDAGEDSLVRHHDTVRLDYSHGTTKYPWL